MQSIKKVLSLLALVCTLGVITPSHAFQSSFSTAFSTAFSTSQRRSKAIAINNNTSNNSNRLSSTLLRDTSQVEETIASQYPIFMNLIMSKNADLWKQLSDASAEGFSVFAANDIAMQNLGEKKLSQLADDRNGETAEKIAAFHAIGEKVTSEELYNSGGVVTLGGVIDVSRSTTGGFMGIGAKEDGGVTINGARIVQSYMVANCIIHEVDALVSPEILWRYIDQLRIPGSS